MKVFQLSFDYEYSLADIKSSAKNLSLLDLNSETTNILKEFNFYWLKNESTIIPDIAIIVKELFCCSIRALDILRPYLAEENTNEILIDTDEFYSLSNIPLLKNVISLKHSNVQYFSTGEILTISKPVFFPGEYPNLFKTEEISGSFFCTEDLMNAIIANNLTGIIFEECKIKSKSWFRK